MKRAVLLDLGGVLVDIDPSRAIIALAGVTGLEPAHVFERLNSSEANRGFDTGALNTDTFHDAVCRTLGCDIEARELEAAWSAWVAPMEQTRDVISRLTRRHELYLLSNTDPFHFAAVRRFGSEWIDKFDGLFLSYEQGLLKPDPTFFVNALELFGLAPEECLFLDDVEENVAAASSAGIESRRVGSGGLTLRMVEDLALV